MGKKILDSKILYIFLSVLLAIALWFYVTSLDGNEDSETISGIQVEFAGVEALEQRGLMIVGDAPRVSVRVSAAPMVLARLDSQSVQVSVDVSQITEASQYTLAYTATLSLPAGVSSSQVQFLSGQTGNVTFTVARYTSRQVEIQGQFVGTVAEGYLAGLADDFVFSPTTLTVSGQADMVNQISYVRVTVDGEGLTDSINGDYPYEFIGTDGEPLEDLDVEVDSETVHVSFPIYATAEIPLQVTLVAGASSANASYELSEDTILVAGSAQAVAAIQEEGALTIAAIDLATVRDGDQLHVSIPLADELTNISGFTEVTVTIHIDEGLETRTVETSNIDYINCPDGWTARILTRVLSVEIRGTPELVESVIEENVIVSVDLSDIHEAAGQYSVSATVYLNSVGTVDQIGVMSNGYEVVVELSRS